MDLFVLEELAHLHEEDLVLVLRPLKDSLPEKEGVAWSLSATRKELEVWRRTFEIVLESRADVVTDRSEFRVTGPTTNRELNH